LAISTNYRNSIRLCIEKPLTLFDLEQVVPIGPDKRVYVNDALVFYNHHIRVQIEGLVLVKDDDHALNRLIFVEEIDVGSLKDLLAHIYYGQVALLEVDLEIQGVFCPH
jgi:hypothetical protein